MCETPRRVFHGKTELKVGENVKQKESGHVAPIKRGVAAAKKKRETSRARLGPVAPVRGLRRSNGLIEQNAILSSSAD